MSVPKIINLGLPKSGTTTLATAFNAAGLRVADWMARDAKGNKVGFVGRLMYKGYFESGDPLADMADFDAYTEISVVRRGRNFWPQTDWAIIAAIRAHHPGARFLLSRRDPESHADSIRRWSNLGKTRLPDNHVPGLPQFHGQNPGEIERWIEAHINFCRHVFDGAEDFLEFDIADAHAPEKISAFTGVDLPWWGKANENENRPAEDSDGGETAPASRSAKA
ncbi:sulfotransferase [Maritimibacter sp. UBA3975]|uniref:sulfotransferase n=1 Tax=Maritimibacter sp. UBA3975 TaxID=1946833 RepID=UPI000C097460|nr:sulfotransferase [Maritimibacter sp. UBA3975]MAM61100.1 sulfotransferase family protein [Maritimibacter sp.]